MNCPRCRTELPPEARFCMHCGQAIIRSTLGDETRWTRLVSSTPSSLAKKMRSATHILGERRVVTALFVDVVGSTSLSEQVGNDTWTIIINGLFDHLAPVIFRYEGTIARLMGDSLLAFFGTPVAHEDDPIRAVNAALTLITVCHEYAEELRQKYDVKFAIRTCINTGHVTVYAVQDDLKYKYSSTGSAINLLSRMKFAAQPMTVLISENTFRFIVPVFTCTYLGPIWVKGKTEPVSVYQVHQPKVNPGQLRGVAGLSSPMVGRDAELTNLLQLCETVRAGVGRTAIIVGEPGLGKTRLIAEWKSALDHEQAQLGSGADARSLRWVEGSCLSYGQELAYHLLVDLLRSIIRIPEAAGEPKTHAALLALTKDLFDDSFLEVFPYLGHLLTLDLTGAALERVQLLDPQALGARYLTAVQRLLQMLSFRHPMVVVLEDLQWADPSSTRLLIRLLSITSSAPILFCLVTRPEQDSPGWKLVTTAREIMGRSLTELTLSTLSETDSRQLVANLLNIEALPARVRKSILKKAEGNPFFIEEVIRMLIDQGAIVQYEGDWVAGEEIGRVNIPDNLNGLLLARIDRLPHDIKHTLRVAAVIGRQFPVKVLAQVLEMEGTR